MTRAIFIDIDDTLVHPNEATGVDVKELVK